MKKICIYFLLMLFQISNFRFRKKIERLLLKLDGGEYWSREIRKIYKKYYGIYIGIGSYGCFDPGRFPRGTKIGNYCSFAAGVRYLNGNHPADFVSTHPLFFNKSLGAVLDDKITRSNLTIGNDVWIGYGVTILSGCKYIGNGAVIGAGSVVTKDVEPYGIYCGVPAKLVKKRFKDYICEELEKLEWWNQPPEELVNYLEEIEHPEIFISKYREKESNNTPTSV